MFFENQLLKTVYSFGLPFTYSVMSPRLVEANAVKRNWFHSSQSKVLVKEGLEILSFANVQNNALMRIFHIFAGHLSPVNHIIKPIYFL